jgi:hypothetical protein
MILTHESIMILTHLNSSKSECLCLFHVLESMPNDYKMLVFVKIVTDKFLTPKTACKIPL